MQLARVNNTRNIEYLTAFGAHLRKLRKDRGWTIQRLALLSGIEYRQVSDIERAKINTTISTLYKLAKALDIPIKALFDFDAADIP